MENYIKKELIENSHLVQAYTNCEQSILPFSEPRRSTSIACGASVFEVCMQVPTWASLVSLSKDFSVAYGFTCTLIMDIYALYFFQLRDFFSIIHLMYFSKNKCLLLHCFKQELVNGLYCSILK